MTRVLLDGNIYNELAADSLTRTLIAKLIRGGALTVLATPVVVDELRQSPFGGVPEWFPVSVECEAVCVIGYAHIGMARLSSGRVYEQHRGTSRKFPDAIIAESAHALADILVSEDRRCRKRLAECSDRCRPMRYAEFRAWLERTARERESGPLPVLRRQETVTRGAVMRFFRGWRRVLIAVSVLPLGVVAYYAREVVRARAEMPRLFREALSAEDIVLSPKDLSESQIAAFLAVQQDTQFFEHKGSNFLGGTRTTVTEALAKHLCFPKGFRPGIQTIRRTLIARFAIDPIVSKMDQLKLYINIVPVGCRKEGLVEGLANGAEVFYRKRFSDLAHDEYLSLLVFDQPCSLDRLSNPEGNARRVRQIKRLLAGECRPPGLFNRTPNCWTEDPWRDPGRQQ